MPSTVSNLTDYLVAGAAREFSKKLAPLNAFSKAVLLNGCKKDDVVRIPFISGSTSNATFDASTGYATANSNVNGTSVTLGTWVYRMASLTDSDVSHLTPESITELGANLGEALAADVMTSLLTTTSSFANHVAPSGSQWASTTAPIDVRLSGSNNSWSGKQSLIINPTLYSKILATTNAAASAYGSSTPIQDGKLPRYYGFDVYESDVVPSTIYGLATTQQSLGVVMSYPAPQEGHNYAEARPVTTPEGLVLGYRKWFDPKYGTTYHVFEALFGSATLNSKAAFNLKVTDINK